MFGYSFSLSSLALIEQQFTNEKFFNDILNAIPSKIAVALGVVYGFAMVFSKLSKVWKDHQINRGEVLIHKNKVKEAQEHLEQEEIKTEKQRKEL